MHNSRSNNCFQHFGCLYPTIWSAFNFNNTPGLCGCVGCGPSLPLSECSFGSTEGGVIVLSNILICILYLCRYSQSVSQSISQSASQPVSQPASQPESLIIFISIGFSAEQLTAHRSCAAPKVCEITHSNMKNSLSRCALKLSARQNFRTFMSSSTAMAEMESSLDNLQYYARKRQTNVSLKALMETGNGKYIEEAKAGRISSLLDDASSNEKILIQVHCVISTAHSSTAGYFS